MKYGAVLLNMKPDCCKMGYVDVWVSPRDTHGAHADNDTEGRGGRRRAHLHTLPGNSTARLYLPHPVTDDVQTEVLVDGGCRGGSDKILLIGEDHQRDSSQLLFLQQLSKFLDGEWGEEDILITVWSCILHRNMYPT